MKKAIFTLVSVLLGLGLITPTFAAAPGIAAPSADTGDLILGGVVLLMIGAAVALVVMIIKRKK